MKHVAAILILLVLAFGAAAQDAAEPGPTRFGPGYTRPDTAGELTSIGFSPTRYVVSILALAGLMGGMAWVLKSLRGRLPTAGGEEMSVQRRLSLDKANSLVLVTVRGEEMLLGIGPNGIRLLRHYDDDPDAAVGTDDVATEDATDFTLPPLAAAREVRQ